MSSHSARLTRWSALISEQTTGGLTVAEFCSERNISIHSFRSWRCQMNKAATYDSDWVTMKGETAPVAEKSLTLKIGGGSVDLSTGFDPHLLREINRVYDA